MIQLEELGFSAETIQALEAKGHDIEFKGLFGEANCIHIEGGYMYGAADSRRNSSAVGY